jgi:hypothetical protein
MLGVVVLVMIFRTRMPDGMAAKTDGVNIWLDDRLNEVQEKCAIEHELEHIARGHSTIQVEAEEMSVRYAVAKKLLPDSGIGSCSGSTLAAAARHLGVTRQVLMDRAATLTDAQMKAAGCFSCRLCPIVDARHPVRRLINA